MLLARKIYLATGKAVYPWEVYEWSDEWLLAIRAMTETYPEELARLNRPKDV